MKALPIDERDQRLIQMLAAISNPMRFRMLEILAERPRAIVADIVERLPIAQATVSQHLAVLREAGLIYGETAGGERCCRIDYGALADLAQSTTGWALRLAVLGTPASDGESCTS